LRGAGGAAGGIGGTFLAPPPLGTIGGATLGAMGGGTLSRILGFEPIPLTFGGQALQLAEEGATAAGSELVGGKVVSLLAKSPAAIKAGWQYVRDLAKKEGIPMRAGDLTGSRGTVRLENMPTHFPIGSRPTTRFAEEQIAAAKRAAEGFTAGVGPRTSRMQAGLVSKEELTAATEVWRKARDANFTAVENAVGPTTYQVDTSRVRAALQKVIQDSGYTPMNAPAGAAKVAEQLERTLPPDMLVLLRGDKITYGQARNLLTQFAERGKGRGTPVVSITQGQNKFLASAMGRDLDAFIATQPPHIRQMADAATQFNNRGKEIFNKELFSAIAGLKNSVRPEQVVRKVFDNVETTLAFKTMASDALWQRMQMAWMSNVMSKSIVKKAPGEMGSFSPAAFVKQLEPYLLKDPHGQTHLDAIFPAAMADRVRGLVTIFERLGRAEQLVGPTATQAYGGHLGLGQLRALFQAVPALLAAGGGTYAGHPGVGLTGAGFTLAAPYAVSKATTNPRVIEALSRGLTPAWAPTAVNLAAHLLGQGAEEIANPRGVEAPRGEQPAARAKAPESAERVSRQHPAVKAALESGLSVEDIARQYGIQVID
jgi:hypothetical protein